jgi:hypothetical protein
MISERIGSWREEKTGQVERRKKVIFGNKFGLNGLLQIFSNVAPTAKSKSTILPERQPNQTETHI